MSGFYGRDWVWIRVVHKLSLCLTQTQPNYFEWGKSWPVTDLNGALDRPDWALLVLSEYWLISGLLQGSKSCRILVEILSNLIRFGWIYQDLADIPPIWPRSSWICRDLVEISLYWRSLSFDLPNFWLKLTICDRERTSHRAGQVCWFLKQPNCNSNQ